MLDLIKEDESNTLLKRYATAFLQLLIGAHGQALVQKLNQELFEAAPDDLPIFDDISGVFKLDFNKIGSVALELLLKEGEPIKICSTDHAGKILSAIAQKVLERLFSSVLDYQALIDSHFRYLFSPKTEWAKFTKMVVFLRAAREYISKQATSLKTEATGYYHDIDSVTALGMKISSIGTSNYCSIIEDIVKTSKDKAIKSTKVLRLNGGINDYYNPYKNGIITCDNGANPPSDQIHVPFILTQSGLKPLTSVEMSRRYVELFDHFKKSGAVVVVGFGFNIDDSHINGMFRELVEGHNVPLYWVCPTGSGSAEAHKKNLISRLRIEVASGNKVKIVLVDRESRKVGKKSWLEYIQNDLQQGVNK